MSAECFHVGEYVQEEMDERGWSVAEMAIRMTPDDGTKNDVMVNYLALELTLAKDVQALEETTLGQETADGFSRALGTGAEVWVNLDRQWRECVAARKATPDAHA